jgi:hypothetical protein
MKDASGQKLAYVYFENEPGRRSTAKLPTKDEARRIAIGLSCQGWVAYNCRSRGMGMLQLTRLRPAVGLFAAGQ